MISLVLQFIIIFVVGLAVGFGLAIRRKKSDQPGLSLIERQAREKDAQKKKILDLLSKQKQISNNEVEKLLGVSNATAERYLNELEKEGHLKQVGRTGRSVYYRPLLY